MEAVTSEFRVADKYHNNPEEGQYHLGLGYWCGRG